MRKIKEVIILRQEDGDESDELCDRINLKLKEGWELYGNLLTGTRATFHYIYQVMVKYNEENDIELPESVL